MKLCEYCREDRDGYVTHLKRKGIGNAHIRNSPFIGPCVHVSGPDHNVCEIPINFCPVCGRDLRKE